MKVLLDSNILIEAARPGADSLLDALGGEDRHISSIARIEVPGYHKLREQERQELETLIAATTEILPTIEIINRAIVLRQVRKMSLGDALIAATALVHDMPLMTRNVDDFHRIDGLSLLEPPA